MGEDSNDYQTRVEKYNKAERNVRVWGAFIILFSIANAVYFISSKTSILLGVVLGVPLGLVIGMIFAGITAKWMFPDIKNDPTSPQKSDTAK